MKLRNFVGSAAAVGLALAAVSGQGHSLVKAATTAAAGVAASAASVPAAPANIGGNVALGRRMAARRGWTGQQWNCLYDLWQRESGWDTYNTYPSYNTPPSTPGSSITTAYGIPQALPAQKMASAGADWQTDPATQVRWGLGYIAATYGTPCGAWNHEEANSWY